MILNNYFLKKPITYNIHHAWKSKLYKKFNESKIDATN